MDDKWMEKEWMYHYFEMQGMDPEDHVMPFSTGERRKGRGGRIGQSNDTSWRQRRDDSREKRLWFTQKFGDRKIITVPSHKIGRIIGKGGCKIRNLEYESEAKIEICDTTRSGTTITLSGTSEAILKVEGMINKLLENRRPSPDPNTFLKKSRDGVIKWRT